MPCHGNGADHCCWIDGKACSYLEEYTVPGRRWACGLLRELGSWSALYADPRYQGTEAAAWLALHYPGYGCGDYPQNIPEAMSTPGIGLCCFKGEP